MSDDPSDDEDPPGAFPCRRVVEDSAADDHEEMDLKQMAHGVRRDGVLTPINSRAKILV